VIAPPRRSTAPVRARGRLPGIRLGRAALLACALVLVAVGTVQAHPLGNFTVNHYAGIRVEPDRVLLDIVIDQAEIPTFQALMNLDEDGDGEFSDEELATAEHDGCVAIGEALTLTIGGAPSTLRLVEAGISFPPGNGGLSTMRQVCTFEAALPTLEHATPITFADAFEAARIGWREMTAQGSGVTLAGDVLPDESTSNRLTAYPSGLAGAPDVRSASLIVSPGGAVLPPFDVPDADPIDVVVIGGGDAPSTGSAAGSTAGPATGPTAGPGTTTGPAVPSLGSGIGGGEAPGAGRGSAAVPGGEGPIPDILATLPVSPAVALVSLLTAALLGVGHALTPGHGKTLMAAYLVGTRGTRRHALGLGAAVSVSHTLGILVLAVVVVGAESALPPDLVVRSAPIVAALAIVAIGCWMLLAEARRWRHARSGVAIADSPMTPPAHDLLVPAKALEGHDPQLPAGALDPARDSAHEHGHGGMRHRHAAPPRAAITWRSLFVLGLAGGIIPSANALLILLATIAAGQPAWGIVLVIAFGLGMAAVMAGVGLAFVSARGLLDRGASDARLARFTDLVPLGAAVLVLGVGLVLTSQALAAARLA
jgi:nickel/cobalt exporter